MQRPGIANTKIAYYHKSSRLVTIVFLISLWTSPGLETQVRDPMRISTHPHCQGPWPRDAGTHLQAFILPETSQLCDSFFHLLGSCSSGWGAFLWYINVFLIKALWKEMKE